MHTFIFSLLLFYRFPFSLLHPYNCTQKHTHFRICKPRREGWSVNWKKKKKKSYQSSVGRSLYASVATRPDIALKVGAACKFTANPSGTHMTAAKIILPCLKGTTNLCLKYQNRGEMKSVTHIHFAGEMYYRHFITGNIFMCAKVAISWQSKKQSHLFHFLQQKLHLLLLSCATQEATWLRRLFRDLQVGINIPVIMMEDN